jgi:hypothetical protein
MSEIAWVIVHFLDALFWLWIVRWGGAEWLEGTLASGLIIHYFAPRWTAEGIKLFGWGTLIGSVIWFFIGLFIPAARFYW